MMSWHISGALGLEYYLAPLPGTFWTMQTMSAPVSEVVSLVYEALDTSGNQESASILSCAPGEGMTTDEDSEGVICEQCPAGEHR